MVYLFSKFIAAVRGGGPAWSKISGPQPELVYLARAQVIVGSNPTRPTRNTPAIKFRKDCRISTASAETRLQTRNNNQPFQDTSFPSHLKTPPSREKNFQWYWGPIIVVPVGRP
jgi:hypothetical protein